MTWACPRPTHNTSARAPAPKSRFMRQFYDTGASRLEKKKNDDDGGQGGLRPGGGGLGRPVQPELREVLRGEQRDRGGGPGDVGRASRPAFTHHLRTRARSPWRAGPPPPARP